MRDDLPPTMCFIFRRHRATGWLALGLLAAFGFAPSAAAAEVFRSYHVGNSFTWDMGPAGYNSRPAAESYDRGEAGYHIWCARGLAAMLENPDATCIEPHPSFGTFTNALSNFEWNAVTLQPHHDASMIEELRAASSLIQLARQNVASGEAKFYVHQVWPAAANPAGDPIINFQAEWQETDFEYSPYAPMKYQRAWYDWFLEELRVENPEATINLIPVAEVLNELDEKFRAGAYPAIGDSSDLYRDYRHLNNVGRYVAHITGWAAMHQTSPMTLAWDEGFGDTSPGTHGLDIPKTEALSTLIRTTVWDVLTSHESAGVVEADSLASDFNGDSYISLADYTVWRDSLGETGEDLPADALLNQRVDTGDYEYWRQTTLDTLGVAGDYNRDGFATLADYTVWRDTLGSSGAIDPADGTLDRRVSVADFQYWRTNVVEAPLWQLESVTTVPESAGYILAFAAAAIVVMPRLADRLF